MASNNIAVNNFNHNIKSCDELITLYETITKTLPGLEIQSKELLRSVIVLSVSALDNYLHDLYRTEIVESYLGVGNFSVNFEKISVSIKVLQNVESANSDAEKRTILQNELKKIQKTESYQSNRSIENIFINLGINKIWTRLEQEGIIGYRANQIKEELANIIDRRNKISHESDWDYFHNRKFNIEKDDVIDSVKFIKNLVISFDNLLPI